MDDSLKPADGINSSQLLLKRYRNDFPKEIEFDKLIKQVEDAIEAGVFPERNSKGSSGSYLTKTQQMETVGVFKPKNEEPYAPKNPKWIKWFQKIFFPCCFGRNFLLPNQGYLSEAGSSLVDEKLGLMIVPKTKVVWLASPTFNNKLSKRSKLDSSNEKHKDEVHKKISLPPKIGSLQTMVDGYKDSATFLRDYDMDKAPDEIKRQFQLQFERLVVLDYLIRNTDRGTDNWLVKIDDVSTEQTIKERCQLKCESGSDDDGLSKVTLLSRDSIHPEQPISLKSTVKIAAIDNGLAFPYKHPRSLRPYSFGWTSLNQAKEAFSDETCNMLLPRLEDKNFEDQLYDELKELFQLDDDFDAIKFEKQMAVIRGQILNLIKALKEKKSPYELVKL